MAKANTKTNKKKRKKGLHLKKQARWTIAGLMMATAIVVALIPVQNGGVSAKVSDIVDPPSSSDIITNHAFVQDTAYTAPETGIEVAFPATIIITKDSEGNDKRDVKTEPAGDIIYNLISEEGMPGGAVVPIYKVVKNIGDSYDLVKYIGGGTSGYSPSSDGNVVLGDNVLINKDTRVNSPFNVGDAAVIAKTAEGTYIKYEEELKTVSAADSYSGITYSYFVVKKTTYEVKKDPNDETQFIESQVGEPKILYATKNSSTENSQKGIFNICNEAFEGQSYIKKLTLPEKLNKIGDKAFKGCSNLAEVTINQLCDTIGISAFESCGLKKVNMVSNSSLKKIGDCAFADCKQLQLFDMTPKSNDANVLEIGSGAFLGCTSLENVLFSQQASNTKLGCAVFAGDNNLKGGKLLSDTEYTDQELELSGVVSIESHDGQENCGIFNGCSSLKQVTFDDDFKNGTVPKNTFVGCSSLGDIKFLASTSSGPKIANNDEFSDIIDQGFYIWGPEGVNKVHDYCAENSVTYRYGVPDGTTYELISQGYLYDFTADENNKTCVINKISQYDNKGEDDLDIRYNIGGYKVVEIKDNALQGLGTASGDKTAPVNITIPNSIETIGDRAFEKIPSLETVSWVQSFKTDGTPIDAAASITLGDHVFANNTNLKEISLRDYDYPNGKYYDANITSIGKEAFKTNYVKETDGKPGVTKVHGKFDSSYYPLNYCLAKSTGKCNNNKTGYILYESREPELLSAQYDETINDGKGAASLIKYPTASTVAKLGDGASDTDTVANIVNKTETDLDHATDLEYDITKNFRNIIVPEGVDSIEKVVGDGTMTAFKNLEGTWSITFQDVNAFPDGAFESTKLPSEETRLNSIIPSTINKIYFNDDVTSFGDKPFANSKNLEYVQLQKLEADGSSHDDQDKNTATSDNPYYWIKDGVLYSYADGVTTLEECLPYATDVTVDPDVDEIKEGAFKNCDNLKNVNMSGCTNIVKLPDELFYDCDKLKRVELPDTCRLLGDKCFAIDRYNDTYVPNTNSPLEVVMPSHEIHVPTNAFEYRVLDQNNPDKNYGSPDEQPRPNRVYTHSESAASMYTETIPNVEFSDSGMPVEQIMVKFIYYDNDKLVIDTVWVNPGTSPVTEDASETSLFLASKVKKDGLTGYTFTEKWENSETGKTANIYKTVDESVTYTALYEKNPESTTSTTKKPSTTSGTGGSGTGGSGGTTNKNNTSTNTNSTTSKSSTSTNTGSGSSSNRAVIISGAPTPVVQPGSAAAGSTGSAATGSVNNGSGSKVATGNTNVVSSAPGLTNNGKMSATVNGSSDNYIIKISETPEADEMAKQALTSKFGSLDNIRYTPFDISLYDSTGQNKISPVPAGVTVSVTMPIPDDLAIYGGNNKVASTVGGNLETIQPRFTVIDGVPCMNYTVSHLSPYVVYVDTANLTEGTLDATPKTADPIHPKWFLCIGLAALSIFLFLKRDKEYSRVA